MRVKNRRSASHGLLICTSSDSGQVEAFNVAPKGSSSDPHQEIKERMVRSIKIGAFDTVQLDWNPLKQVSWDSR